MPATSDRIRKLTVIANAPRSLASNKIMCDQVEPIASPFSPLWFKLSSRNSSRGGADRLKWLHKASPASAYTRTTCIRRSSRPQCFLGSPPVPAGEGSYPVSWGLGDPACAVPLSGLAVLEPPALPSRETAVPPDVVPGRRRRCISAPDWGSARWFGRMR